MSRPAEQLADAVDLGRTLSVSEVYLSLQGEGADVGRVCWFIRLAGCHLSCPWCDTPYTWKPGLFGPDERRAMTLGELLDQAGGVTLVELTGGEPLLQPACRDLLVALCEAGHEVLLETSGSLSIAGLDPRVRVVMDLKAPSSGHVADNLWPNVPLLRPGLDELKIVIADRADFEWAAAALAEHPPRPGVRCALSPATPLAFTGDLNAWPLPGQLASWIMEQRLEVTLQLQLHRLLWPRARRGTDEGR